MLLKEESGSKLLALPNSCVDDALDAGVLERIRRPDSLSSGGRDRRDFSVRRIDDQPRATAFRDLERVAKLKRAYSGRAIDHLLVSFRKNIRQFRTRHILDSSSGKLPRTFERRALLVLVRVGPLQVGIAPWRSRRCVRKFALTGDVDRPQSQRRGDDCDDGR